MKLICYYCTYGYQICEPLFKKFMFICSQNLKFALSSKRSLSSILVICLEFLFKVIIFIFLSANVVIIIIIIVAIHRSQSIYTLSTIIVKYQFLETTFISLIADRIHIYKYAIRNISFNRKIYSHIYSSIMCRSIFDMHQITCK